MKNKREIASLLPYRKADGSYEFYLQKRSASAKVNPGIFGIFGGGIEGNETPEEGMRREIREELAYEPVHPGYLSRYEASNGVLHLFFEEVEDGFEEKVVIGEGEYGRFLKTDEILFSKDVSLLAQTIIQQFIRDFLEGK